MARGLERGCSTSTPRPLLAATVHRVAKQAYAWQGRKQQLADSSAAGQRRPTQWDARANTPIARRGAAGRAKGRGASEG